MKKTITSIPNREQIENKDKWNLSKLYKNDAAWEKGIVEYGHLSSQITSFKGTLANSPEQLCSCLKLLHEIEMIDERVGYYAHLRISEDAGNSEHQQRYGRYLNVASRVQAEKSFLVPEIQAIPDQKMNRYLAHPSLKGFSIFLTKLMRYKPHVLLEEQERLLALQLEANQTTRKAFSALTDVDLDFGLIETQKGLQPLSQSSWSQFMINPDRDLRRRAYLQFYSHFDQHKNTLATLYAGNVLLDQYHAQVRNYPTAREAALFPDRIEPIVYDNLIATVHANLDQLHSYYDLRRRKLEVKELRHYDVYVPLTRDVEVRHTYDEAVEIVIESLVPLGEHYCNNLRKGLHGGWVDRYENKGKRSGAFSAGSYVGDPYILMNFKEDVLRDVFTLAHEGGHSMHSLYSVQNNPIQHYSYSIFEAEVASTFNEQILFQHLLEQDLTPKMHAYLIGKQVDDIIATIYRQTMFAEFEHITHQMIEAGEPLTVSSLRNAYKKLLEQYFGPGMKLEDVSDLECLRIPHFYNAFYVYKYATGLAAAITLSDRVLNGGLPARNQYLSFLKSGGSRYPLESLQLAGVDMKTTLPVEKALEVFKDRVNHLEQLL